METILSKKRMWLLLWGEGVAQSYLQRDPGNGSHRNPRGKASPTLGAPRVIVGGIHMIPLPLLGFTWPSRLSLLRWQFLTAELECLPPPPNQKTLVKGEKENDTGVQGKVFCPHGDVVPEASMGTQGLPAPMIHLPTLSVTSLLTSWHLKGLAVWMPLGKWSSQPPKNKMVSDKEPRLY